MQNWHNDLSKTLRSAWGDWFYLPLLQEEKSAKPPEEAVQDVCDFCLANLQVGNCKKSRGPRKPALIVVGDFPSQVDHSKGEPFRDSAGDLLHKMLAAIKLAPESCFFTNLYAGQPIVKSDASHSIFTHCYDHLAKTLSSVDCGFVLALGQTAAKALAHTEAPLSVMRSQVYPWQSRKVFVTHHPRDLMLRPQDKKEAWNDLQFLERHFSSRTV